MMRNSKHFVLGAATLLLSTAGFTACSSEDTFTGGSFSGESVKTQFAINIPVANSVNGRLSQDIVQGQNQPVFRGMDNIKLIPFAQQPGEGLTGYDVIGLGAILNDELAEETNAKVYYGEFYQFNLSSCIRQQNSLTAQFVSFSLSNLANIFYPPQFLQ